MFGQFPLTICDTVKIWGPSLSLHIFFFQDHLANLYMLMFVV